MNQSDIEITRLMKVADAIAMTAQDAIRREMALLDLLSDLVLAIRADDDRAIAILVSRAQHIISHKVEGGTA